MTLDEVYEQEVIDRAEKGTACGWCDSTEQGPKLTRWPHTTRVHAVDCGAATWLGMARHGRK